MQYWYVLSKLAQVYWVSSALHSGCTYTDMKCLFLFTPFIIPQFIPSHSFRGIERTKAAYNNKETWRLL